MKIIVYNVKNLDLFVNDINIVFCDNIDNAIFYKLNKCLFLSAVVKDPAISGDHIFLNIWVYKPYYYIFYNITGTIIVLNEFHNVYLNQKHECSRINIYFII